MGPNPKVASRTSPPSETTKMHTHQADIQQRRPQGSSTPQVPCGTQSPVVEAILKCSLLLHCSFLFIPLCSVIFEKRFREHSRTRGEDWDVAKIPPTWAQRAARRAQDGAQRGEPNGPHMYTRSAKICPPCPKTGPKQGIGEAEAESSQHDTHAWTSMKSVFKGQGLEAARVCPPGNATY